MFNSGTKTLGIFLLLVYIIIGGLSTIKYLSWKKTFTVDKESMTCYSNIDLTTVGNFKNNINLEEQNVEISAADCVFMINDIVKSVNGMTLDDACIKAEDNKWTVYVDTNTLPWAIFTIEEKDGKAKISNVSITETAIPVITDTEVYNKFFDYIKSSSNVDIRNIPLNVDLQQDKIVLSI